MTEPLRVPTSPPPPAADAGELRRLLDDEGLGYEVHPDGALAVLLPTNGVLPVLAPPARRRLVQLATRAGFTHVALELPAEDSAPSALAASEAGHSSPSRDGHRHASGAGGGMAPGGHTSSPSGPG